MSDSIVILLPSFPYGTAILKLYGFIVTNSELYAQSLKQEGTTQTLFSLYNSNSRRFTIYLHDVALINTYIFTVVCSNYVCCNFIRFDIHKNKQYWHKFYIYYSQAKVGSKAETGGKVEEPVPEAATAAVPDN